MKECIEGFMVRLEDGSIWEVKGFVHPPDRLICYPRYIPVGPETRKVGPLTGKSEVLKRRYRIYLEYLDFLKDYHPCIPVDHIVETYNPLERRGEILDNPRDRLEEKARKLLLTLEEHGARLENIGITGSMLAKLHNKTSDIDLIVYGSGPSNKVYMALLELRRKGATRPLTRSEMERVKRERRVDTPECTLDSRGRILEGAYCGVPYSIKLCEVDQRMHPNEMYVIHRMPARVYRGIVVRASPGYMIPWPAEVSLESREGVVKVFTLRMRFTEIYSENVRVEVKGSMEKVMVRGRNVLQISVNRPGDYVCRV